ncbi:hypothetical protein ALC53_12442 [Atta colombica]|uniref:Uncharacterized protein n=1 Tax=Atta colombica TaxID=520822 RepID=A0A195AYM7_9HYME|nr:hypothetical protein ALC53_12442 [Atta colombica]
MHLNADASALDAPRMHHVRTKCVGTCPRPHTHSHPSVVGGRGKGRGKGVRHWFRQGQRETTDASHFDEAKEARVHSRMQARKREQKQILKCKMNVLGNGVSSYQILCRLKVNERSQGETFRKEKSPSLLLVSFGTFQKTSTTAGEMNDFMFSIAHMDYAFAALWPPFDAGQAVFTGGRNLTYSSETLSSQRNRPWRGKEVGSSVKLSNIIYLRRTADCCTAWMATNGILLYAMKKPLNDERTPDRIRNRLIGQKNAGDNESHYLMVIPPLNAIEDDTATRVSDNEWTYCR